MTTEHARAVRNSAVAWFWILACIAFLAFLLHGCAVVPILVGTAAGWWVGTSVTGVIGVLLGAGTAALIVKGWDSAVDWWNSTWFGVEAPTPGDLPFIPHPPIPPVPDPVSDWFFLLWAVPLTLFGLWLLWKFRDRIAHIFGGALDELDDHVGPKEPKP